LTVAVLQISVSWAFEGGDQDWHCRDDRRCRTLDPTGAGGAARRATARLRERSGCLWSPAQL